MLVAASRSRSKASIFVLLPAGSCSIQPPRKAVGTGRLTSQLNQRYLAWYRAVSEWASVMIFLVGVVAIVGWAIDNAVLKSLYPDAVSMKFNTAVSFCLIGISLWLSQTKRISRRTQMLALVCAGAVTLIGLASLAEYVFGWDAGIDQFIFGETEGTVGTYSPGRMAAGTSLSFVLVGMALLLLDVETPRGHRPSQFLVAIPGAAAIIALLGYTYGISSVYALAPFTAMALNTAPALLLVCLSVWLARPDRGAIAIFAGVSAGSVMARRLLPAAVVIPLALEPLLEQVGRAGLFDVYLEPAIHAILLSAVFVALVASIGQALDRLDAERRFAESETLTRNRHLEALYEVSRAVADSLDLETTLARGLEATAQSLGVDAGAIYLMEADGASMRLRAHSGLPDGMEGVLLSKEIDERVSGMLKALGMPVVLDTTDPAAQGLSPFAFDKGFQAAVVLPMLSGGELLGALSLAAWNVHIFAAAEIDLLSSIGQQLGASIRNARLYEKTRSDLRQIHRAEDIRQAILRSAMDSFLLNDFEGRFLDVNDAYCLLTGYRREELLNMRLQDVAEIGTLDGSGLRIHRAKEGAGKRFETEHKCKDGRVITVEFSVDYLDVEGGLFFSFLRDITKQKIMELALHESEEKYRTLAESSEDFIFVVDGQMRVQYLNRFAAAYMGLEYTGYAGKHLGDIFLPIDFEARRQSLQMVFELGESMSAESKMSLAGHEIWLDTRLIPFKDPQGKVISVMGVSRDTTERKRLEESLKASAAGLSRSNEDLQQFAYVASHDLQEPLRAISSYVQLLEQRYKGRLDTDADDFINYAVDGANRLQTLINDLLRYSRVDAAGAAFEPVDCEAVLGQALSNLSPAIEEASAVVSHDPLPVIRVDSTQIGQLFQNLIGNAVKFRGEKPPEIHIGAERRGDWWQFFVRDNGIGMAPEFYDRVFLVFQRLHGRAEYPGTGIGLALCKKIVEHHGGRIWVESEPGKGATFYFTLPSKGV